MAAYTDILTMNYLLCRGNSMESTGHRLIENKELSSCLNAKSWPCTDKFTLFVAAQFQYKKQYMKGNYHPHIVQCIMYAV